MGLWTMVASQVHDLQEVVSYNTMTVCSPGALWGDVGESNSLHQGHNRQRAQLDAT